jgi:site-specific DNA-methyltransferase (adenine-specific)
MEDTPEEYINQMVKVFNEVRRVLRNDGTLWLNLGDTFDNGQQLIPARVALALVADGWKLIQDIIWYAPNKMPESVTNRCTKSHEHIFLLSKGNDYYFDSVAIHKVARMTDEIDTLQRTKGGFAKNDSITVGANKRDVWIVPTQHLKMRDDLTPEQKTYVVGELIRRGLL